MVLSGVADSRTHRTCCSKNQITFQMSANTKPREGTILGGGARETRKKEKEKRKKEKGEKRKGGKRKKIGTKAALNYPRPASSEK